jgi:DNA-binding transcriptional regulator YdaS (Cro superfamily)
LTLNLVLSKFGGMNLSEYIKSGRGNGTALAEALRLSPSYLSQLASGTSPCSPERCVAIERATDGSVRRWDMRPMDWHLIWPELITAEGAPAPADDGSQQLKVTP